MTISIPSEALKIQDGDESVLPGAGESFDFTVTAKVVSTEGDNITVDVTNVNGMPLPAAPEPAPELDERGLQAMAMEADENPTDY